jgi:hypothetical protein
MTELKRLALAPVSARGSAELQVSWPDWVFWRYLGSARLSQQAGSRLPPLVLPQVLRPAESSAL